MEVGDLTTRQMRALLSKYNKEYKIKSNKKIEKGKYKLLNANELVNELDNNIDAMTRLYNDNIILTHKPKPKYSYIKKVSKKPIKFKSDSYDKIAGTKIYNEYMKTIIDNIEKRQQERLKPAKVSEEVRLFREYIANKEKRGEPLTEDEDLLLNITF